MELQQRIDRYVPLNTLEGALKYLFLNNIPLDRVDYDSRSFQRSVKLRNGRTMEETIRALRKFISSVGNDDYMSTDMYIPEGRSLYIRQFPRYLIDNSHFHKDALEINVVLQGEFYQKINGQILRLCPGDICFVAPRTVHASRTCDDNTVVLSMIVYQKMIPDLIRNTGIEEGALQTFFSKILLGGSYHPFLVCRTGFDEELMGLTIDMEENQAREDPYTDLYMRAGLEMFVIRLLMKYRGKILLGNDIARDETDILNLMNYIEANYRTVTLNSLAEAFHYSAGYLSVLVKKHYGRSFQTIITDLKLSQAVRLLETTNDSMSVIAEAVGYSDKSYFLRRFRQKYHMTPTEYRNR